MLINAANLDMLRAGFNTAFTGALSQTPTQYGRIATEVRSTQKEQKYGWLGKMPNVREWVGSRAVQNLSQHDYAIAEKAFELTIAVDRDDVETDNLGIYGPMFTDMGDLAAKFPDKLVWELLKEGFETPCYDGQNYFDTDHPVLDENGNETSVSNTGGGAGAPWFLLDVSRSLKPIILQKRKDFTFVAKDKPTDGNVFDNNEFVYGSDARMNVGFGFWQFAYGSKQPLDAASYEAARQALTGMKGDGGKPLGIRPSLLVVPPTLEGAALKLLNNELAAGGETNEWKGTAEPLVVPWLA